MCLGVVDKGKMVKYLVTEGNLTLGSEHTMQYTDYVLLNRTLETYIILLTSITLINLLKEKTHK